MINIMLTCSAGMSTSLLVLHMQDEAKKRGLEANIWAVSETTVRKEYAEKQIDCILVGPQLRYLMNQVKTQTENSIPVELIDMRTYGMMDGKKALDQALKAIENWKK